MAKGVTGILHIDTEAIDIDKWSLSTQTTITHNKKAEAWQKVTDAVNAREVNHYSEFSR